MSTLTRNLIQTQAAITRMANPEPLDKLEHEDVPFLVEIIQRQDELFLLIHTLLDKLIEVSRAQDTTQQLMLASERNPDGSPNP